MTEQTPNRKPLEMLRKIEMAVMELRHYWNNCKLLLLSLHSIATAVIQCKLCNISLVQYKRTVMQQ